eukprot:c23020_g1_i1 orf=309-2411(+)
MSRGKSFMKGWQQQSAALLLEFRERQETHLMDSLIAVAQCPLTCIMGSVNDSETRKEKTKSQREHMEHENQLTLYPSTDNARIVVAVKINDSGRMLLRWTLTRFAKPGDSIFVIHVVKNYFSSASGASAKHTEDHSSGTQIDGGSSFNVLQAIISSCSTDEFFSKVNVTLQILEGNHVGRAIVEIASKVNATSVVVGKSSFLSILWHTHTIGSYCVKNLPPNSKVMIVCGGNVVAETAGSAKGEIHPLSLIFNSECQSENSNIVDEKYFGGSSHDFSIEESCFEDNSLLKVSSCFDYADEQSSQHMVSLISENVCLLEQQHSLTDESFGDSDISYGSEGSGSYIQDSPNSVLQKCVKYIYLKKGEFSERYSGHSHISLCSFNCVKSSSPNISSYPEISIHRNPYSSLKTVIERTVSEAVKEGKEGDPSANNAKSQNVKTKVKLVELGLQKRHFIDLILQKLNFKAQQFLGKRFSYKMLQLATRNFSHDNLLGTGGSSSIYKGRLLDGGLVAVKVLTHSADGEKEFTMEIAVISGIYHRHLVQYIGYCMESCHRLLVFNFVPNGNLQQNLYGDAGKPIMNWKQRQKVALGAARGLEYLHFSLPQCIIHRDVKSSNILLTEDYDAQAKFLEREGKIYELVDQRLKDVDMQQLKFTMYAAFSCIKDVPEERPDMRQVVALLDPELQCGEPLLSFLNSSDGENA